MHSVPRILITTGEPAGIGPDVVIQIAQQAWHAELIVVANAELLLARATQLNLPLKLVAFDSSAPPEAHRPGQLKIISLPLSHPVNLGYLERQNAAYVVRSLEIASDYCQQKNRASSSDWPRA